MDEILTGFEQAKHGNTGYTPNPNTFAIGKSLLFDFGPQDTTNGRLTASPDVNGHHWNSWRGIAGGATVNAGEHFGNLIDTTGAATGIDITLNRSGSRAEHYVAGSDLLGGNTNLAPANLMERRIAKRRTTREFECREN